MAGLPSTVVFPGDMLRTEVVSHGLDSRFDDQGHQMQFDANDTPVKPMYKRQGPLSAAIQHRRPILRVQYMQQDEGGDD